MDSPVEDASLFRYLAISGRPDLLAKSIELRARLARYLPGIYTTFAHYTSHLIDHSDEIVRAISAVAPIRLDKQSHATAPAQVLNPTETYFMLIAAYLHDAGMVVSEQQKISAIQSRDWQRRLRSDDTFKREHDRINGLFAAAGDSQDLRYAAGMEERVLIAEFFRRQHATRSEYAINDALFIPRDFLESDPIAARTVVAICQGHGLNRQDLLDESIFPTRRTVFGEEVNVRLLAVLLRIGDLLDIRFQRACPLMSSIGSPLPRSSAAHWLQYQAINDKLISEDEIRIGAQCQNVDEHRLLRDWFQWLVDEIHDAPALLASSERHRTWRPPRIGMDGPGATIKIDRKPGAKYRVVDWRFEMDREEVLTRLIENANPKPLAFLAELIQNALDTTRARRQLLAELPTYEPVVTVQLDLNYDGKVEALTVNDEGMGMNESIVQQYLLQVGRSWYRSPQFQELFSFSPSSRFGIGFLSCFSVSDDVSLVTRWHESQVDAALQIHLPGARNYLALEETSRDQPGTSVRVRLRSPIDRYAVQTYLSRLCVANDIPVRLEVDGATLVYPLSRTIPWEQEDIKEGIVRRRYLRWNEDGVTGEVEFFTIENDGFEGWDQHTFWIKDKYALSFDTGPSWLALNGLQYDDSVFKYRAEIAVRLDVRQRVASLGLDRRNVDFRDFARPAEHLVSEHLQGVPVERYRYRERVARKFEHICAPGWYGRVPATRRTFRNGETSYVSEIDVLSAGRIGIVWVDGQEHSLLENEEKLEQEQIALALMNDHLTLAGDLRHGVGLGLALRIEEDYVPSSVRRLSLDALQASGWMVDLEPSGNRERMILTTTLGDRTIPFSGDTNRVVCVRTALFFNMRIFNADNPLVRDLKAVLDRYPDYFDLAESSLQRAIASLEKRGAENLSNLVGEIAARTGAEELERWAGIELEFDEQSRTLLLPSGFDARF